MVTTELLAVPPAWIEVLPAGPEIMGNDGRRWRNDAPDQIVSAFQTRHRETAMVIDYEHASEHRAPQGLDAPAAGWIDRLEVRRGGSIWAHVQAWTERAAQQIRAKEYRYLSPVFLFEPIALTIKAITSIALTNSPNLNMTALNRTAMNTTPQVSIASLPAGLHQSVALNAARCWDQGDLKRTYGTREKFIEFCLQRAAEHEQQGGHRQ